MANRNTKQDTEAQQCAKYLGNPVYQKAIRFIANGIYEKDPDVTRIVSNIFDPNNPTGLNFLVERQSDIETFIDDLKRGVHTVQRYFNIITRLFPCIPVTEELTEVHKDVAKRRYLRIAALAKREYRQLKSGTRKVIPTVVFERVREMERNMKIAAEASKPPVWNFAQATSKKKNAEVLNLNLKHIIDNIGPVNYIHVDKIKPLLTQRLVEQVDKIEEYRKSPSANCITKSTKAVSLARPVSNYKRIFYNFMAKYNPGLSMEHLLSDYRGTILDKLREMNAGHQTKEGILTAIKYYLGCAHCLHDFIHKSDVEIVYDALDIEFGRQNRAKHKIAKEIQKETRDIYEYFVQKYGLFITRDRLRREVWRVRELEPDMTKKIIMTLYIDYIPRRTSDFTRMVVIKNAKVGMEKDLPDIDNTIKDDNGNIIQANHINYLLLYEKTGRNPPKDQFIFNYWKNSAIKGTQIFPMDRHISARLRAYLTDEYLSGEKKTINGKEYPYLLYVRKNKHERVPLVDVGQMNTQLQQIRNRWDIPFSVRSIRHLYVTWMMQNHEIDWEMKQKLALSMGTSVKMLESVYYDAKCLDQLSVVLSMANQEQYMSTDNNDPTIIDKEDDKSFKEIMKELAKEDVAFLENFKDNDKDDEHLSMYRNKNGRLPDVAKYKPPVLPKEFPLPKKYCGQRMTPCSSNKACPSICPTR